MPRDFPAQSPIIPDLTRPTLRGLSYALRNTPTHEWDYTNILRKPINKHCNTAGCAYGLAIVLWGDEQKRHIQPDNRWDMLYDISETFDIPVKVAGEIFDDFASYGVTWFTFVTATMVADKIDAYLAAHPDVA